jgi:hypothetical protein
MVNEKKLNESAFAKIVKEIAAHGELIRTRQNEKQAVLDHFDSEKASFHQGKIAKKGFESSAGKINKELSDLDKAIRKTMRNAEVACNKARRMAAAQAPRHFRATTHGLKTITVKKK